MSSSKCAIVLLIAACCLAFVAAHYEPVPDQDQPQVEDLYVAPLIRRVRSPEGGRVVLEAREDQAGRGASVQYNHNLYTSKDGRGTVEAYGQASRNFDHNRNDYGGGIRGRWSF